jgi:hypothetical protein
VGGYGSRRWGWGKKTSIEDCKTLDLAELRAAGLLAPGKRQMQVITWRRGERVTGRINILVDTLDPAQPRLRAIYTVTRPGADPQDLDYKIPLTPTLPNYGGKRWWLVCPLIAGDRPCLRRVRVLYLPPGGLYFGCRACYNLTYTSCQESDKRISRLLKCAEAGGDLRAMVQSDPILVLKAMSRRWR